MRLEFGFDDYRPGVCDRCCSPGPVMIEIGTQAESVCRPCIHLEREHDYAHYRELLACDLGQPLDRLR